MSWINKIMNDITKMKVRDEEYEKFLVLNEGNHTFKIKLSTKDYIIIDNKIGKVKYTIFNTVDCDKPYLRLTGFQYGLLLKKITELPGYPTEIPEIIEVVVNVTRSDNDKLEFDISVVPGDVDDKES